MARFVNGGEALVKGSGETVVVKVVDNLDAFLGCSCVHCVCDRAARLVGMDLLWVDDEEGYACFSDDDGAVVLAVHGRTVCDLLFVLLLG